MLKNIEVPTVHKVIAIWEGGVDQEVQTQRGLKLIRNELSFLPEF